MEPPGDEKLTYLIGLNANPNQWPEKINTCLSLQQIELRNFAKTTVKERDELHILQIYGEKIFLG
jgi:hypothetical protein